MSSLDWLIRPIAHRGLHDRRQGVIENTASAVRAAIESNYAIEVDLRASSDMTPMVFHDRMLDRLTSGSGKVSSRTAAELTATPFLQTDDRMMRLSDLLDLVDGRTPLVLELKSHGTDGGIFESCVAAGLAGYGGDVAVMSFYPASVAAMAAAAPDLPRGIVAERFIDDRAWRHLGATRRLAMRHLVPALSVRPHFIAYDVNALPALAPFLARKLFGLPLLTWTVRSKEDRERAETWADAMIFEGFRP